MKKEQTCAPVYTNTDLDPRNLKSVSGGNLSFMCNKSSPTNCTSNGTRAAIPCGLIARSFFNDTFLLSSAPFNTKTINNSTITLNTSSGYIPIDSSNIAWKSDADYKFFNQKGNW